jgi:cytochrome c oxidase subunit IV
MKASTAPVRQLCTVYGILMALLALTTGATVLPVGWWSTPISMAIATAKAVLIFTFFMRLRSQGALVRIFALAGFFWLAILLVLTSADFFTRAWGG